MLQGRCIQICCYLLILTIPAFGKSVKKNSDGDPFQLEEFLLRTFSTRSFNGSWFSDDSILYRNSESDYEVFDLSTEKSSKILEGHVLKDYPGSTITFSPDKLYVLIRYNVSAVFRHSTTALYAIYDTEQKTYYDVAEKNPLQLAKWSPVAHGLVYVLSNNIYYLKTPGTLPSQVTNDGKNGILYNGVPDWVYEEEVLGTGSAIWFSPNGKRIAFASFDDRNVSDFHYSVYGTPGISDTQYPTIVTIKYPKVNTINPDVRTYVANLESELGTVEITPIEAIPEKFLESDYIFYDLTWITNNEITFLFSNRVQNEAELIRCDTKGTCAQEASYKEEKGWLDIHIPKYNQAGDKRIEILPQSEGNDYFNHLVLTHIVKETPQVQRLTFGRYVVMSIYGWDEVQDLVYFLGTREDQPSQQHVYVVKIAANETQCLTCEMKTSAGYCKYAGASFNGALSRYAKICQGPGPFLVEIRNINSESDVIVWEDNQLLQQKLASKLLPITKDLKVSIDSGFTLNVRLLLPPDWEEGTSKKYPAVVAVYGGPDSNQISDMYSYTGFQNYIVTNRKYIYIYIDGRGSGKDGKNKMFQVYRRLGTVEIQDQIAVTKYLQETLPYIDANNTGIWGWSYGGFATAQVMEQDTENVFKFGLSVAPVTNFILYDSIYTERYMGLPTEDDNLVGYNNTDVTRNVEALRGKLFFLIHGNADDNVHYQQSMLLSRALELADISFRQQSYPDENHSLGNMYPHLYHTIDRFWANSFNLPNPPL